MPSPARLRALLVATVLLAACAPAPVATPVPSVAIEPTQASNTIAPSPSSVTTTAAPTSQPSAGPSAPPVDVAWNELDAEGPSAREDHTWTVDPATRVAYLFGGRDGGDVRADVWAYDLAADAWRAIEAGGDGPAARFGHEAVWRDGVGLVVWAGQAGPTTFFDDLWAFDPATGRWSELPNDGDRPVARYGSCSALAPDGRLWISHGFTEDGTRFADTRVYDFDTGRWTDETPDGRGPVNRCLHGCWWTDADELALYAGQTTGVQALGDLWRLGGPGSETATWTRVEADLPEDRNLYAFARHGDRVIVFGGQGLDSTYYRDVYALDATTLAVEPVEPDGARPPARSGATLIDDPAGGRVLLFGGRNGSGAFDDTWTLALP